MVLSVVLLLLLLSTIIGEPISAEERGLSQRVRCCSWRYVEASSAASVVGRGGCCGGQGR